MKFECGAFDKQEIAELDPTIDLDNIDLAIVEVDDYGNASIVVAGKKFWGKVETPPQTEEEKILAPYRFEIEETYREEGQRAGDRLVASILRQEGFEPTSPKEQESTRQAVQNEMTGGTSSKAEYEEMAEAMEADKEHAIQDNLSPTFKVGDTVEFYSKSTLLEGTIAHIDSNGEARIVCYGNNYYASVDDLHPHKN